MSELKFEVIKEADFPVKFLQGRYAALIRALKVLKSDEVIIINPVDKPEVNRIRRILAYYRKMVRTKTSFFGDTLIIKVIE